MERCRHGGVKIFLPGQKKGPSGRFSAAPKRSGSLLHHLMVKKKGWESGDHLSQRQQVFKFIEK
jgi:hypothetical protein